MELRDTTGTAWHQVVDDLPGLTTVMRRWGSNTSILSIKSIAAASASGYTFEKSTCS
jgi:hypothetical protein